MNNVLIAAVACLLSLSSPVFAQSPADTDKSLDELFGGHKPYADFFAKLQTAVAADDKATVAGLVDYPFQARIGGKAVKIKDADHFSADYDKVVTQKVKAAVAKQTYATLFANWQGVMVGDGEVWFSGVGKDSQVKITAIND
ncbi:MULTISPECIES: hypothetical protein [unclassified Ensifer]|uniref:hypothetical protein n=1 Tax=unclassified Ensifer TaxID=2633371 RepID=UPI0008138293|nr:MULTISPECIES: hypothetical protein [unclassified Ensifer]OCP01807.1 hypothetical protein BC362_21610 [Ensifer sp. LC14]OCP09596.1 hypothetical protein BC374_03350 [Ensifer sp. LC13]OCP10768.1 hypothetical protein BBX50_03695 [Ensifer sp. LC11]OCP32843.1 hypothetical protein BC364_03350 [Ensifer sp. LC499]